MSRTDPQETGLQARWSRLFADDPQARINAARAVTAAALLCGIALSPRLWFSAARSFPRAPLADALPAGFVAPVEYFAGGLLVVALVALLFGARPRLLSTLAVVLLGLLVLLDQTRLQPWVYQYLLLLTVAALHGRRADGPSTKLTLAAMQLIVAALYFWSGAQKLNYSFGSEILPQLLAPLTASSSLSETQWVTLGVGVAAVELLTGVGLLHRRTRRLCVRLALGVHAAAVGLLVLRSHNSVVWGWNAALMLLVVILFRRGGESARPAFDARRAARPPARAALILSVVCAVLPASSFWGWWDMYLSGALYSGNTSLAVVRVDERVYERLPEVARRQVFRTKSGERMLPALEWSLSELNVPPYPEPRVFKRVAREVCASAGEDGHAELIMRGRPAALDGSYRVFRMDCSQLRAP